jgi:hypothetical protein
MDTDDRAQGILNALGRGLSRSCHAQINYHDAAIALFG